MVGRFDGQRNTFDLISKDRLGSKYILSFYVQGCGIPLSTYLSLVIVLSDSSSEG